MNYYNYVIFTFNILYLYFNENNESEQNSIYMFRMTIFHLVIFQGITHAELSAEVRAL